MATIGTLLYTWLKGEKVGEDEFGNKYYRGCKMHGKEIGRGTNERRWVVYKGLAEPTKVPPYWHGWLHHVHNDVPKKDDATAKYEWEKQHLPNLSGTDFAYDAPKFGGKKEKDAQKYTAWKPKNK